MNAFPPAPPMDEDESAVSSRKMVSMDDVQYGWNRVDVLDEGRIPCPRSLHAAAVWNGSFFVFGGYDGHSRVNDMYEYNIQKRRWRSIPIPMISPSPRDRHVAVAAGNSFYIFGGFDGGSRVNDFWAYSFETSDWIMVPVASGEAPSARHSHMAVTYKNSLYIFGGYDGSYKADFHEYNFETETWRLVQATGRMPRPRYRASCVVYGETMIMFGGHDGTRHLNDTNIFNFTTGVWSQMAVTRATPSPRDSHIAVVFGDSMFVFGGSTGEATDDFYELKLGKFRNSWSRVSDKGQDQEEDGDGAEYDDEDGRVDAELTAATGQLPPSRSRGHDQFEDGRLGVGTGGSRTVGSGPGGLSQLPTPPGSGFASRSGSGELTTMGADSHDSFVPGPRFCHVGQVFNDALYIFGGYDGSARLNDFIRFRFGSSQLDRFKVPPPTIMSDLRGMVNNEDFSDVTFLVEDTPVWGHKLLLARCDYFKAMLCGDMREASGDPVVIPDIQKKVFLTILEYLYTDEVVLDADNAMDLFQAADQFGIGRLKNLCENTILKNITIDNAASVLYAADMFNAKELREKCLSFILVHFAEVTKTPAFEEMGRTNIELVFEVLRMVK
jgi:leucine-zipper-like transcriptional regulator 1